MNEVILPDFELLFDDNAAGRQLDRVRLVASACLMISTVLFGAFPLSLRLKYSEEWILRVFRRPTQTSSWSVITTAMICACSGVLIALVFVCLIPAFAAMVPEKEKRGPGLDMSMGLMVTLVFQEFVFLRFGNRDSDYINQCHVYIVQFIRCELNVWKTLPVEPRRPSEEEQDEQELAAELLRMTELRNSAVPLDLSQVNAILTVDTPDDAPGRSRYGGYFARKQFYLRRRYPLMNYTVYFGATLLTLHSFADGFCMALQPSIAETWYVFGNLLIHRVLFAVITTTELMSSNFRSRQIAIVLFILSLMPSLGSFFGTFVARRAKNPTHLALMMGFSAGSLLYVIFFELFRSDKQQHMIGPAQCLSTFTGFLLSTFAYIWTKGIMNA